MSQNSSQDPFYFSSIPSPFDTYEVSASEFVTDSLAGYAGGVDDAVSTAPVGSDLPVAEPAEVPLASVSVDPPETAEFHSEPVIEIAAEVAEADDLFVQVPQTPFFNKGDIAVVESLETESVHETPVQAVEPTSEVALPVHESVDSQVQNNPEQQFASVDNVSHPSAPTAEVANTVDTSATENVVSAAAAATVASNLKEEVAAGNQRTQVTSTQAHTVKIKFTAKGPVIAAGSAPVRALAIAATPGVAVASAVPVEAVQSSAPAPVAEAEATGPLFSQLPLSEDVQKAVRASGYLTPTDIQLEIIPHVLEGRDVLAQSQTGTGKTAAFALPILSKIDTQRRSPQVLVLAPTRELAMQVSDSFSKYGSHIKDLNVLAIYGGQAYETQLRQLRRGVQVVVGTPGRVIDHIKRNTLDLSQLECLVLDEADEMLNMGFLEDVQFVLEQTPPTRQVALFSATLPAPIRAIAQQYLKDPVRITIKQKTMTAESIRQRAVFVPPRDRVDALVRFLEAEESDGVIVFTKTREATVTVAEQLCREGLSAVALNGDMAQNVRERTIEQLKNGKLDILVATDVAARGLDVTRISHVFNYDMPHDSESYIHRIGRTGRAGRSGQAIIFLTNTQRGKLRIIERATKQPIEVVDPPTAIQINAIRIERFKQRISDVVANQDLSVFQQMLADYASVSGQPMEVVAAALALIGQQGRSFLMQDRPRRQSFERDDRNGGNDRFERRDSRESGGADRGRAGRPSGDRNRQGGPPESGMDRYRIEVGHDDGVKPSNIVGAVANEGGIDGEYIGPIRIHDSYSTIDLPEGMPREVFQTLQRTRVAGKELQLRLSTEEREQSHPRRSSGAPQDNRRQFSSGSGGAGSFRGKPKPFAKRRRPSDS